MLWRLVELLINGYILYCIYLWCKKAGFLSRVLSADISYMASTIHIWCKQTGFFHSTDSGYLQLYPTKQCETWSGMNCEVKRPKKIWSWGSGSSVFHSWRTINLLTNMSWEPMCILQTLKFPWRSKTEKSMAIISQYLNTSCNMSNRGVMMGTSVITVHHRSVSVKQA